MVTSRGHAILGAVFWSNESQKVELLKFCPCSFVENCLTNLVISKVLQKCMISVRGGRLMNFDYGALGTFALWRLKIPIFKKLQNRDCSAFSALSEHMKISQKFTSVEELLPRGAGSPKPNRFWSKGGQYSITRGLQF